jgi:hypothetical protein
MIISIDAHKAFEKIKHDFIIKNSQQIRYRGNIPQHNKTICDKATADKYLMVKSLQCFL